MRFDPSSGMLKVLLFAAVFSLSLADDKKPTDTPDKLGHEQQAKLKERERLKREVELLRQQNKLAEALAACEKKLAIEQQLWGTLSDDIITSLNQLAEMHEEREEWPAATKRREHVLQAQVQRYGERDWRAADARRSLADTERLVHMSVDDRRELRKASQLDREVLRLHADGEYSESIKACRTGMAIKAKLLGSDHLQIASNLSNLGVLLQATGDYLQAQTYHEQALAVRDKALESEHPDRATSLNNLGYLLLSQGDYARARRYIEQAIAVYQKTLGSDHPHTAASSQNLASVFQAQGDFAEARKYYEQALSIHKKALVVRHSGSDG